MVIVLKNCHNNNNITSFRSATQNLSCTAFSNFWSLANVLLYFHSIWRYKHKGVGMLDLVYCFQTIINSWYTCIKSLSISSSHSQITSLKLAFHSSFCFLTQCLYLTFLAEHFWLTSSKLHSRTIPFWTPHREVMVICYHFLSVLTPEPESSGLYCLIHKNATSV